MDGTLPEATETSSEAEISSHLCESFFLSPESTLECEQPVRRVYQSLALAVDSLLEMVLDSSRQLEEARQIHDRFEKEFSCKSEEMARVGRKHQELLQRLEDENAAQARLTLELHKAEGVIEGFKVEKASLQEALGRKEVAEQGLVVELEGLSRQLQQATRQLAELQEENAVLLCQREAAAAQAQEAREREAGRRGCGSVGAGVSAGGGREPTRGVLVISASRCHPGSACLWVSIASGRWHCRCRQPA